MADIDIVQKKSSSVWLWVVLGILALAVLFWFLWGGTDPTTTTVGQAGFWEHIPGVMAAGETGQLAA